MKYLDHIAGPADVKKLSLGELDVLASEVREALIAKAAACGGHVGPNLGFVEATIALHYVFDSPKDKLVFDVSHQTYTHKMLTGRSQAFLDPARYADVSGFSQPGESEHDLFTTGHTSTAVSMAAGLALARDLAGGSEKIIAIVGDGALSGGEALEGLDIVGERGSNMVIVVNDNEMSIAENHGGLYKNLAELRASGGKALNNIFRTMGLDYLYVEDGNDIASLIAVLEQAKDVDWPIVVHLHTRKGKGLACAEADRETYHSCGAFDPATGAFLGAPVAENYNDLLNDFYMSKMAADPEFVFVNAATPRVFGFTRARREQAGSQYVDVGIAEQSAASVAAGIATYGGKVAWGVWSSFVQRSFDQISQDICINRVPATIMVYNASVSAASDVTHLGIYDIALLANIPNLVYLAPASAEELLAMTAWSLEQREAPVAIRVPVGPVVHAEGPVATEYGSAACYQVLREGSGVAIVAAGNMLPLGAELADALAARTGVAPTLVNPRYLTGVDEACLAALEGAHQTVVTIEDGILDGGFGEKIARFYGSGPMRVRCFGLRREFLDRFDIREVLRSNHLTVEQMLEDVLQGERA